MFFMVHCIFFKNFFLPYFRIKSWVWFFRGTYKLLAQVQVGYMLDVSVPARLEFNRTSDTEKDFSLWILGTDYDSFAVVHKCQRFKDAWVIIHRYMIPFMNQFSWFSVINYPYFAYSSPLAYNYGHGILQLTVFSSDSVIFILTRKKNPDEEVIMKAVPVLDKNQIVKSSFSRPNCYLHW